MRLHDHKLFSQHFRTLDFHHQLQHMKFVYDQQPLGVRIQQRSTSELSESVDKCPCCSVHREDQVHFLRCTFNPSRSGVLLDFVTSMRSSDSHAVSHVIMIGISKWLADDEIPLDQWDLSIYPPHMRSNLHTAIKDQTHIGWLSCLKGFLCLAWSQVSNQSMVDATITNSAAGPGRLRIIMQSLRILSHGLWLGRNDSMHNLENCESMKLTRVEDIEIKHYYDRPEMLNPGDRHYCSRSLTSLLKSTPSNRRRWLRQVKKARQRRIKDLRSQSQLTQFFSRASGHTVHPVSTTATESDTIETTPTVQRSNVPLPPPDPPPSSQRSILDFFSRRRTS